MATKTKEIKKSTKTTKKAAKPAYTVDLTDVQDAGDAYAAFGWAKINAYLTNSEIDAVAEEIAQSVAPKFFFCECTGECPLCKKSAKKPNIFKRFWNWITRKK